MYVWFILQCSKFGPFQSATADSQLLGPIQFVKMFTVIGPTPPVHIWLLTSPLPFHLPHVRHIPSQISFHLDQRFSNFFDRGPLWEIQTFRGPLVNNCIKTTIVLLIIHCFNYLAYYTKYDTINEQLESEMDYTLLQLEYRTCTTFNFKGFHAMFRSPPRLLRRTPDWKQLS